jgi:hypothetical protein
VTPPRRGLAARGGPVALPGPRALSRGATPATSGAAPHVVTARRAPHFGHVMVRTLLGWRLRYCRFWIGGSRHVDRSVLCDHGLAWGFWRPAKTSTNKVLLRRARIQRHARFSYIQPARSFAMSSPDGDVCPVRDELLGELCRARILYQPWRRKFGPRSRCSAIGAIISVPWD